MKKIPYLRWRKSTFNVYSLTEGFTNKPKPKKKQIRLKYFALISFNV